MTMSTRRVMAIGNEMEWHINFFKEEEKRQNALSGLTDEQRAEVEEIRLTTRHDFWGALRAWQEGYHA